MNTELAFLPYMYFKALQYLHATGGDAVASILARRKVIDVSSSDDDSDDDDW